MAKNAAALAAGATEAQGLNAAGAAAGHIFLEVWRYAERQGARPESMIGLAGTGDLVGTALAPQSRNRRAGELLAQGVPAAEIPGPDRPGGRGAGRRAAAGRRARARAHRRAGDHRAVPADRGELPLDEWVAPRARDRPAAAAPRSARGAAPGPACAPAPAAAPR